MPAARTRRQGFTPGSSRSAKATGAGRMSDAALAAEGLCKAGAQYDPQAVEPDTVHFRGPDLFVRVRPMPVQSQGGVLLYIAVFAATTRESKLPIEVTCVGFGADAAGAAAEAATHWCV